MRFVKKINKLFIFWITLLSLASVLVANGIDFHSEKEAASEVCSFVSMNQHDGHHDKHMDPCTEGFCHLGHCSSVNLARAAEISYSFNFVISFHSAIRTPLERSLEEPFQPPRA